MAKLFSGNRRLYGTQNRTNAFRMWFVALFLGMTTLRSPQSPALIAQKTNFIVIQKEMEYHIYGLVLSSRLSKTQKELEEYNPISVSYSCPYVRSYDWSMQVLVILVIFDFHLKGDTLGSNLRYERNASLLHQGLYTEP